MAWLVKTTDRFDLWLGALNDHDRASVIAAMLVLQDQGPQLGRPTVDSVKGSRHSNMKELRMQSAGKPLRAFFAFDPERSAILLCAGDKTGDKRFYRQMIPIADQEFDNHLQQLTGEK